MAKIFVSYARKDIELVKRILLELHSLGFDYWMDTRNIQSGAIWPEEITKAILDCNKVLLFMSAGSMASDNVQREVQIAYENKKKIIILKLENVEIPNSLRYQLTGIQWTDYSSPDWKSQLAIALKDNQVADVKLPPLKKPTSAWIGIIGLFILLLTAIALLFIRQSLVGPPKENQYAGRVIDQNSQEPIIGAQISLDLEGVPPIVYTDSVGVYRFNVVLPSNISAQIRVEAKGYQVYTRNISLSPDRTSIEDIRLTPLSSEEPPEATLPSSSSEPTINETEDSLVAITNVQPSSGEWVHADSSQCLWTNATGQGAYIDLTLAGESTVSKFRISLFDPFVRRIRLTFSDNSQQIKDLDEIADYAYQDVSLDAVVTSTIRVEVLEVQDNAFGNFGICHIEVFGTEPTPIPAPDGPDHIDAFGVPMRLVPAGSFMMGSDADTALAECEEFGIDCKLEWFINEEPVHEVQLDAYYIDKYEVTNKFYEACVNAGVCRPPIQSRSFAQDDYYGNSTFDDYPVVFVNWDMAETYCEWRGARLPTEAQWEKAARGTDGRIFPWGNDIDYKYANFDQIIRDTTLVSQYEKGKSPYGVYDLAGNTVEWVYDWYSETYYQNSPSSNPMGPGPDQGDGRVVRGGSWFDKDQIRSAWREGWEPFTNRDGLGFRCAMNVNP